MKFLVTGSAGLVGSQVIKDLTKSSHQTYSCYHNLEPEFGIPTPLNIGNFEDITRVTQKVKPDVIIHLAAITNVDLCEKEKDLALKINAKATETLSKEAARQRAFFVYVSTDYVFDGKKGMKRENDIPNPVDYYGESKLVGEKSVMQAASSWSIARTSTPFGLHPQKKSFPAWVAENLRAKKEIFVVEDQFTSPTYVPNLSRMIIEIATRQIVGVIHLAGATRISRYEMAQQVADKLNLDNKLLKPSTIDKMSWVAKRPKDSSLDVSFATSILRERPLSIDESLDLFTQEIKQGFSR